ncbi:hypothetical protein RD792_004341 [Penstemon davidsonii]|uniref:Uncharacterized protein n=1 Tax=Penstemon davidsonii TaxID=160366 RepID=A0ABR0DHY1_9LAMI|nr:hypothetical protein RD792_004341 [Penstemon davidsonii]
MAVLLEDIVKSVEQLLKLISKKSDEQTYVDPTLDPVLLVPGIAGSILNAVDAKTGSTVTLDADTHIEVPQDRYGLHAIDTLDPDMVIGGDCVYYFHDMIVEFLKWGYQEGTTLFGFGYDFRQSNRLVFVLEVANAIRRPDLPTQIITGTGTGKGEGVCECGDRSDAGLLLFEKYVKNWIAIAAPFQGAPGYIASALLNGVSFVEGWEQNFFISKWSMQQLLIECPSIYELMACLDFKWEHTPLLEIWRQKNSDENATIMLESYPPAEAIPIFMEALSINKVSYGGSDVSFPFNVEILKWADETRKLLSCAEVPNQIKFYNIYGTNYVTPHSVCYGSEDAPISDLRQLPTLQADGLRAEARVGVPGNHRGILCDHHVFRILKHWLKADHDPFYNPVNDYVILPTAFDIESLNTNGLQVTTLKEEWEVVGEDQGKDLDDEMAEKEQPFVSSISVSRVGSDKSTQEEARAIVTVQSQSNGKKHVELNAVSISAGA